ncbi:Na+/H+ antiporter subunit E [Paracoccus alkanivorans]|uniref:Na+/H+ antiporter subunit E n=1 Tax=Paracoccus alkanivorans TaxID=2116655 RepID=A0A3M0MJW6_9RHOB|nr:Na+/H+ antiporter subunit E [Paracoccus alkanivorans]RMC37891.1 Na+/H+ antiporter subunit E [Paracoccus alkanivorans]
MIRRIFPHPYLSALLILIWMLLVNRFAWGSLVFATILSIAIPALTEPYWPDRAKFSNPGKILSYIGLVIWDIIMANIQVAMIVLFKPNRKLQPAWITIPLELRSPEAITVLASTITLTPGTVSADLSQDGHALLVHCLHAPDPESVIAEIKSRYEARLMEIFE